MTDGNVPTYLDERDVFFCRREVMRVKKKGQKRSEIIIISPEHKIVDV